MSKKTQTNQTEQSSGFEFNMRLMNGRVSTCHTDFAFSPNTRVLTLVYAIVRRFPPWAVPYVSTGSTFWRKTQQRRRWRLNDVKWRRGKTIPSSYYYPFIIIIILLKVLCCNSKINQNNKHTYTIRPERSGNFLLIQSTFNLKLPFSTHDFKGGRFFWLVCLLLSGLHIKIGQFSKLSL